MKRWSADDIGTIFQRKDGRLYRCIGFNDNPQLVFEPVDPATPPDPQQRCLHINDAGLIGQEFTRLLPENPA